LIFVFFFQAEDGIRDFHVTGVQTCALPILGFSGLLAKFAEDNAAQVLIRGVRAVADFEYEFQLASMNRQLNPALDSIFMTPSEKNTFISSTLVKEVCRHGGDVSSFVPAHVETALKTRLNV